MHSRLHLRIAGQVLVWSCGKVFAVTVPIDMGRVERIQLVSQALKVDLPMPWPLDVAWRTGSTALMPSKDRLRTSRPISSSNSRCHLSGPSYGASGPRVSFQGYANITKPRGSSRNSAIRSINAISGCSSTGVITTFERDQPFVGGSQPFDQIDR